MSDGLNLTSPCARNKCDISVISTCTGCPEYFNWKTYTEKWNDSLGKLLTVNRRCPKCKSNNFYGLSPEMSAMHSYVCLNCHKYFTENDMYVPKHAKKEGES